MNSSKSRTVKVSPGSTLRSVLPMRASTEARAAVAVESVSVMFERFPSVCASGTYIVGTTPSRSDR